MISPSNTRSNSTIKVHAYIAELGLMSRRKAEAAIAQERVRVNNELAHIGQRINPQKDVVKLDGAPIIATSDPLYYLIDKPRGTISTTSDELGRKTVLDVLPKSKERLFPVGRLDADSEGMLILTNDGELAHRLTHPSFGVEKTYEVTPDRPLSDRAFDHLSRGVKLTDGWAIPVAVTRSDQDERTIVITLSEGRSHEIRRMMRRVGYEVERLRRVRIGGLDIDSLEGKTWKRLSQKEVQLLSVGNRRV